MSNAAATLSLPLKTAATVAPARASRGQIFLEFLRIGATSFGGAVPYLHDSLVGTRHWLDDREFVEMLSISQSLPGLNATNMAILVGEKLGGAMGATAAIIGMCLPSAVYMYIVGIYYHIHGDHVWVTATLKGVAAAAVGLILFTVVGLCQKSLGKRTDLVFVALTVIAVNGFHQSVPRTLIVVGILAIAFHRPQAKKKESSVP